MTAWKRIEETPPPADGRWYLFRQDGEFLTAARYETYQSHGIIPPNWYDAEGLHFGFTGVDEWTEIPQ